MEKISLSYGFAKEVWKNLEKRGIPMRTNPYGFMDCSFTPEELAKVKHISLVDNSYSIKGISHLVNLESLNISTTQLTAYTSKKDLISIEDNDVFEIEKLANLKHLTIDNQRKISQIDVSNLKSLQTLQLTRCEELVEITGLSENRSLSELVVYDVNNLSTIKNLDKFIENNQNLSELNLDVLLFPSAIGYKHATGQYNLNAFEKIQKDLPYAKWSETVATRLININNHQMHQMHKKALDVVRTYCKGVSDVETVASVDLWLSRNVKYNYDALDSKLRGEMRNGVLAGPIGGANGAYNALMYNSCVCEGYTRAMQYMLTLKGIKTANTHCIEGKDELHLAEAALDSEFRNVTLPKSGYHSICRIERDSGIYYCDPCWNASMYQRGEKSMPYFLLSKEEISQDHTLSYNEQNVSHQMPVDKAIKTGIIDRTKDRFNAIENEKVN